MPLTPQGIGTAVADSCLAREGGGDCQTQGLLRPRLTCRVPVLDDIDLSAAVEHTARQAMGCSTMKTTAWMVGMVLAGAFASDAQDSAFWRVLSSVTSAVTSATMDGVVSWSNSVPGQIEQLQRATSMALGNWQDYTQVPSTGTTTSIQAFDPHAPAHMVLIPAGSFVMGGETNVHPPGSVYELPQHTVYVSAFYMDKYEVTEALWGEVKAWGETNGYVFDHSGSGKDTNHPVQMVNWYDVIKWCNARSQRDGLVPRYYTSDALVAVYTAGTLQISNSWVNWSANGYRLPTEAEWEKAARGGAANARFPWTDYSNKISHAKANYYGEGYWGYDLSGGYHPAYTNGGLPYTSPVGSFPPNGYGLHDMAGNVEEWVWDRFDENYYSNSPYADPRGCDSGAYYSVRGGSWYVGPSNSCCAWRNAWGNTVFPDEASDDRGFRCARGL